MRVLFVASVDGFIRRFLRPSIQYFRDSGFEVHTASKGDIQIEHVDMKHYVPFERSPYKLGNIKAYKELKRIIDEGPYDIIHCNTPMASFMTRYAARKVRRSGTKVIYIAHGFHFYKGAPILNWIVYYPIEKWMARYTDVLITINSEDYARAERFKADKVEYIPGMGVDVERFSGATADRDKTRNELGIPGDAIMVLSVGELNSNKNHEVIIRALAKLNNSAIHFCIVGRGSCRSYLEELCEKLNVNENVHFIGYRNDIADLMHSADIYIQPSKREGLSVALMEAMACGLPCVVSNIRGNVDLIENGAGGCLYAPDDSSGFAAAIDNLATNSQRREKMGEHNKAVIGGFDKKETLKRMREIYDYSK